MTMAYTQSNPLLADLEGKKWALLNRPANKFAQSHQEVMASSRYLPDEGVAVFTQKGGTGSDHSARGNTSNAQSVRTLP